MRSGSYNDAACGAAILKGVIMEEISRREATGVAVLAGVVAMAGLSNRAAASDGQSNSELEEQAERQRVIACGLNEAEADCWVLVSQAAAKFFELPQLHEMDDHEVAHAVHVVQQKLLSRPVYRRYKELLPKESK